MCSYNAVDGVPACSSSMLAHASSQWGFRGYTTSDSDAVKDAFDKHHYFPTAPAASCGSITKGKCDINSGNTYSKSLLDGVDAKLCDIADVNAALARTLKVRFDLGLFDPNISQPLTKLGAEVRMLDPIFFLAFLLPFAHLYYFIFLLLLIPVSLMLVVIVYVYVYVYVCVLSRPF